MWCLTFQKCNNPQEADDTNSKTLATLFNKHMDWAEIKKNSLVQCDFVVVVVVVVTVGLFSQRTLSSYCDNKDRIRTLNFLT